MSRSYGPAMTQDIRPLVLALERVGRGDATAAEATAGIRKAIDVPSLHDRVYAVLRDMAWRIVRASGARAEQAAWFDLTRHAQALAKRHAEPLALRLGVLSDMIEQTARFDDLQPNDEVLARKHVADILKVLVRAKGPVRRSRLASVTSLAEANLSRVLNILTSHRLVERSAFGREAVFTLSGQGKAAAAKLGLAATDPAPDPAGWWDDLPVAIGVWDKDGTAVGANDAFRKLFAQPAKTRRKSGIEDWRRSVQTHSREMRALAQDGAWEAQMGDHAWVEYKEQATASGWKVVTGVDVSAHRAEAQRLEERVSTLSDTVAGLHLKLADAERRLSAHRSAIQEIRHEILHQAASVGDRIRLATMALEEGDYPRLHDVLRDVEPRMRAVQVAMRDFVDVPAPAGDDGFDLDVMAPRELISEAVATVNAFSDPDIDLFFAKSFQERVRAPSSAIRSALGQMLMFSPKRWTVENSVALHCSIHETFLVLSLGAGPHTVPRAPHRHWVDADNAVDRVADLGLMHCWTMVSEHGGYLKVGEGEGVDEAVCVGFPISKVNIGRKRIRRTVALR